jgi:hypothetical protein
LERLERLLFQPFRKIKGKGNCWKKYIDRSLNPCFEWNINQFFKGVEGREVNQPNNSNNSNCCQLCHVVGHSAFTCSKLIKRPKCIKCNGLYKMENFGLNCTFFFFGMGRTKEWCWKKNGKGPITTTYYVEVLVNDEEATLVEFN